MFGSAFLLPSDCSTTSIRVAIATRKTLVLSVLNLEKVENYLANSITLLALQLIQTLFMLQTKTCIKFKNSLFFVTSETTAHKMGLNGNSF